MAWSREKVQPNHVGSLQELSSPAYRVDRDLALYQATGGTAGLIFRGLSFRNKADAGKPSLIWGKKMRIRPQCRVTTPLWAPGADSGQREKKTKSGAKFGPKMTAVRDPGVTGRWPL